MVGQAKQKQNGGKQFYFHAFFFIREKNSGCNMTEYYFSPGNFWQKVVRYSTPDFSSGGVAARIKVSSPEGLSIGCQSLPTFKANCRIAQPSCVLCQPIFKWPLSNWIRCWA